MLSFKKLVNAAVDKLYVPNPQELLVKANSSANVINLSPPDDIKNFIAESISLDQQEQELATLQAEVNKVKEATTSLSDFLKINELNVYERNYRYILSKISDAVIIYDGEGKVHIFNPAAEALFGYASAEMQGQRLSVLFRNNNMERFFNTERDSVSFHIDVVDRQNKKKYLNCSITFKHDANAALAADRTYFVLIIRDITELKLERQKGLTIKRLMHAFDACTAGLIIADLRSPGFPIISVNQGLLQITGRTKKSFINCSLLDLYDNSTDVVSVAKFKNAVAHFECAVVTLVDRRKDGTEYCVELRLTPSFVKGKGKKIAEYITVVVTDITERRKLREAAETQAQFNKWIIDALPVGIAVRNEAGLYCVANKQLASYMGKRQADILGASIADLYPAERASLIQESDAKAISNMGKLCLTDTGSMLNPRSDQLKLVNTKVAKHLRSGKFILSVTTDQTELQSAYEGTADQKEFYEQVLNYNPVALAINEIDQLGAIGNFVFANKRFYSLFGGLEDLHLESMPVANCVDPIFLAKMRHHLFKITDSSISYYYSKAFFVGQKMSEGGEKTYLVGITRMLRKHKAYCLSFYLDISTISALRQSILHVNESPDTDVVMVISNEKALLYVNNPKLSNLEYVIDNIWALIQRATEAGDLDREYRDMDSGVSIRPLFNGKPTPEQYVVIIPK